MATGARKDAPISFRLDPCEEFQVCDMHLTMAGAVVNDAFVPPELFTGVFVERTGAILYSRALREAVVFPPPMCPFPSTKPGAVQVSSPRRRRKGRRVSFVVDAPPTPFCAPCASGRSPIALRPCRRLAAAGLLPPWLRAPVVGGASFRLPLARPPLRSLSVGRLTSVSGAGRTTRRTRLVFTTIRAGHATTYWKCLMTCPP
jgi:hypothetical protein